jgi:hypothetical protein
MTMGGRKHGSHYICSMRHHTLLGLAIVACILGISACKPSDSSANSKSGKWLPYPERAALEEQHLRRSLQVEKREAMTNTVTDSGEVWFPSEIILYNAYGLPTLLQLMNAEGQVTKETKYEYKDSLLLREVVQEYSGFSSAMHFTYNAQGQRIGELLFQRGDSVLNRSYKLDPLGNEVEVSLHRFRDDAHLQLLTERDAQGRPTKVQEMQDGKANWTETYAMSDSLWRIRRTDAQGQLQSDYEMRFDPKGAIIQMVNRSPEGKPRMTIDYTNDAQGRPLKEQYFGSEGQPMQGTEFRYSDKGLLVERSLLSPGLGKPIVTRYSYFYRK